MIKLFSGKNNLNRCDRKECHSKPIDDMYHFIAPFKCSTSDTLYPVMHKVEGAECRISNIVYGLSVYT